MNRLVCLLVACSAFTTTVTNAQQAASRRTYSVVGDVERPQTYAIEQSDVHAGGLLDLAGLNGATGNLVVLRGAPLKVVATERVDTGVTVSTTKLLPEDIVVFQSSSNIVPGIPNALVRVQGRTDLLPLPNGSLPIGNLLSVFQLPAGAKVPVTRTAWGAPSTIILDSNQDIVHGDVVDLEAATTGLEAQLSGIDGTASEVSSESPHRLPLDTADTQWEAAEVSSASSDGGVLTIPAESSDQDVDNPFRVASLESFSPDMDASSADSTAATPSMGSGSSGILNVLFLAGLLVAMGLILAGWVKTRHEREVEAEIARSLKQSLAAESLPTSFVESDFPELATGSESPGEVSHEIEETPILSVGEDTAAFPVEDQAEFESEVVVMSNEVAQADLDATLPPGKGAEVDLVEASEWFSGDWISSEVSVPKMDLNEAAVASHGVSPSANVEPETNREHQDESDNLDDLIHNRIPVELKKTELPLRVSLFGRPSGPRRLRIDAAHSQLAAPHMLAAKKRSAKQRPIAAVQTRQKEHSQNESALEKGDPSASSDYGRFDKALNYLEEQSDT